MPDGLALEYRNVPPTIARFFASSAFVRGLRGPVGSGKSTACCFEIMRRAKEQLIAPDGVRHSRWAVIRNTYPELKTTTIKTWHGLVPQNLGRWVDQGPPTHHLRFDDVDLEVLFLALDSPGDVAKLLSLELTGAWINEAREVPKAVLDALTTRVGRYPSARIGGPSWFGVLMDTNPPDTDHWWFRLAEEDRPNGFEFFAQPSGLSAEAENLPNLPPGYYERQIAGKTEDWIRVYVHGDYGFVQEGKPVVPEYRDGMHCKEFELDARLPLVVGADFGLTPAAVIGQRHHSGQIRWRYELVTEDMGAKRFAGELRAFLAAHVPELEVERFVGDPSGDNRSQTDEHTVFQILRAEGLPFVPASTNDFTLRRDAVGHAFARLIDGEPACIVHPDCKVLRKGLMGGYQMARIQVAGAERYQDKPVKNMFSHVCEAQQYGMLGLGEGRTLIRRSASATKAPSRAITEYNPFG
jgi:hypothetical protein